MHNATVSWKYFSFPKSILYFYLIGFMGPSVKKHLELKDCIFQGAKLLIHYCEEELVSDAIAGPN